MYTSCTVVLDQVDTEHVGYSFSAVLQMFALITMPVVSSSVVTEQGDQGSVPCQPLLLALCRHSDPGHNVHALRSQHGAHHQDTATPATKVHTHTHIYTQWPIVAYCRYISISVYIGQ